jgi:hypothetical protein
MSATVINLADELARRALLLSAQNLVWEWLSGRANDVTTLAVLRVLFADEGRRLSNGSTRIARAERKIVEISGRDTSTPREIILAIWQEADIGAPWLCQALNSSRRFAPAACVTW